MKKNLDSRPTPLKFAEESEKVQFEAHTLMLLEYFFSFLLRPTRFTRGVRLTFAVRGDYRKKRDNEIPYGTKGASRPVDISPCLY